MQNIDDFQVRDAAGRASSSKSMYAGSQGPVLQAPARETFEAVTLLQSIQKQPYTPAGRRRISARPLRRQPAADRAADQERCRRGGGVRRIGGWDPHVNEVAQRPGEGQLANLLSDFGQSLAAFYQDMGDRMEDVVVVTMSEFGRTAKENGNRGTDHGHANCMFVMGGGCTAARSTASGPAWSRSSSTKAATWR